MNIDIFHFALVIVVERILRILILMPAISSLCYLIALAKSVSLKGWF